MKERDLQVVQSSKAMMILGTALAFVLNTTDVSPKIVAASLFKNGYTVVTREIPVGKSGEYLINSIPQASLGTLWFYPGEGTKLEAVESVDVDEKLDAPYGTLEEILQANEGKSVILVANDGYANVTISGVIKSASGQVVVLEEATTRVVQKNAIRSITADNGKLAYKRSITSKKRVLRLRVGGSAGSIRMISLERGMTWSPGYAVDISDKNKLKLIAKATVLNDLEDLQGIDASFITGFPNVPFANYVEPLLSGQSVEQFLGVINSIGAASQVMNSAALTNNFMTQQAFRGTEDGRRPFTPGDGMPTSPAPGQQIEDLFFYKSPNFSLSKNNRSYQILFRAEADFKELHTWDITDSMANNFEYRPVNPVDAVQEIWHTLKFKNTSGQPLTTAPATTFKDGQIIGQDTLKYVSTDGNAELRITKAMDIRPETTEVEVSRERGAIKNTGNYPIFDLVTLKGTIQATNQKSKKITIRIRKDFTGELVLASGMPISTKTAKGLRDINPTGRLEWTREIEPGKSIDLNYSYKVYVRTQN